MKYLHYFLIASVTLLYACSSSNEKSDLRFNEFDKLLTSVSWYQHSAEMNALYHQGFNIAKERLDKVLEANKQGKPLAVVVDIDETMLDNSPFETTLILKGETKNGWNEWTDQARAEALPGALEFARYAQSKNVDIFYVTNRDSSERSSTLKNLDSLGFPNATQDHLLTRDDTSFSTGNTSSKAGRRAKVASTHEIVLLIGDNLNDFSEVFEDRKANDGKAAVEENKELFGRKFIILPNPIYGAWEKPLIDFKKDLSESEKSELMKAKLK
jgi:5'-nucleotidase (lipoprotein e(P4) family)